MSAASAWGEALRSWAIPEQILRQAPEPPWVLPPKMFRVDEPDLALELEPQRLAREALGQGGTVLDVGCGGGAASLPLVPWARAISGVDKDPAMLLNFARACEQSQVAHTEVLGDWPEAKAAIAVADVVLCHHVVYNVADIGPFVRALTGSCRRRVVVVLTDIHPTSPFNPLWEHFWQLSRPTEPTVGLFLEVLAEEGIKPQAVPFSQPVGQPKLSFEEYVAFARTRLCLPPNRDPEVALVLEERWPLPDPTLTAVAWSPA
ncbi:MAG: class I SAM-dependent methyltransferase [Candidatus Dormibacteria bacterium]